MRYYFAPMEGLTDRIYRQAHHRFFGAEGAPARYYAPFLSPPLNQVLIPKKMADILPENNPGVCLVPQLLSRDAASTVWMLGELRALGYREVNLNFGCPSGTVTAKGKGAGMLRDPAALDAFLYEVFARSEGPLSVKTRLGIASAEEFGPVLEVYNRYPICELILHPRVQKQLYRGAADREAFARALAASRAPVCYNGDLYTAGQLRAFAAQYPQTQAVMVGRGLIADPALLRKACGGAPADRETLRAFLDELYRRYTEEFGGAASAINRMKAVWFYAIRLFDGAARLEKQLKKLRTPWEYEVTVGQIFAQLPLREDAAMDADGT